MNKYILEQYSNALARVNLLKISIKNLENKMVQMNKQGYYVTDVVSRGKKGKKSLGTVVISGFPYGEYEKISRIIEKRKDKLLEEEKEILELVSCVEEYIAGIEDFEMRNILSLYYVENLTWVQVAHKMNAINQKKNYSDSSCRQKHERFLEKNL